MGLGDSPRGVGRAKTESCQVKLQQTLPLIESLLLQQTWEKNDMLVFLYGCLPSPRNQKKIKTSYSEYKLHLEGLHSMGGLPKPWDCPLSARFSAWTGLSEVQAGPDAPYMSPCIMCL